jgi:catechol 2,3-dioxygenase
MKAQVQITDPETPALGAHLDHLQILSPNPRGLAEFYGRCLGMTVTPLHDQWLCQGPQRSLLISSGAGGTLGFAAYAVADSNVVTALTQRLEAARIPFQHSTTPLFEASSVGFSDPDGHHVVFGVRAMHGSHSSQVGSLPARLQHLVLASTNADGMLSFYRDIVGFRLTDRVTDGSGSMRTCFLRTDHEHHSLAIFLADSKRLDHHCYETSDWNSIRDWGDHFASLRVPVEWGPGRHGPGNNLFVFIHDPDGNWVEISAELEEVTADRPVGSWPHEERTLNSWGRAPLRS